MSSSQKHILFIFLFILIGSIGTYFLFPHIQLQTAKTAVDDRVNLQHVTFSNATVDYYPEMLPSGSRVSLGYRPGVDRIPPHLDVYDTYYLQVVHTSETSPRFPLSNLAIRISYAGIDTTACEVDEQNFRIYQYNGDHELIELPTTVHENSKSVIAQIPSLPIKDTKQAAYFVLTNEASRFIEGGCGNDATIYIEDGTLVNKLVGYKLPLNSSDFALHAQSFGVERQNITFPYQLNPTEQVMLDINAYSTTLPLNQADKLVYKYEFSSTPIMINEGEQVVNKTLDTQAGTYIFELQDENNKIIRVARLSESVMPDKTKVMYVIESSLPVNSSVESYSELKDILKMKAASISSY